MYYCECKNNLPCDVCINKREMAQTLRNAVMRMKIAKAYGDPFIFEREKQDLGERIMWEQWAYLHLSQTLGLEWA